MSQKIVKIMSEQEVKKDIKVLLTYIEENCRYMLRELIGTKGDVRDEYNRLRKYAEVECYVTENS